MVSAKKSLFDKLTGAIKFSENSAEEKNNTKLTPKPENSSDIIRKKIAPKDEKTEETEEFQEESSWPGETEGQLALDVYQTDSDIIVKSTIGGVEIEDLDISVTNDMLTIRGYRRRNEEIPPENYFYQECYWGPFSRSIILPSDVDSDKAEASLKNGLLTIKLPKIEKQKTRKIKIKSS